MQLEACSGYLGADLANAWPRVANLSEITRQLKSYMLEASGSGTAVAFMVSPSTFETMSDMNTKLSQWSLPGTANAALIESAAAAVAEAERMLGKAKNWLKQLTVQCLSHPPVMQEQEYTQWADMATRSIVT